MFRRHGPGRTAIQNRALAGYLALIGGFVNSAGFILIGTFTSHVTGTVGRFSNDLAALEWDAAGLAFTMILAFFTGAFIASMMIESNFLGKAANAYGVALVTEAFLLVAFMIIARLTVGAHPRVKDAEAMILCMAMGMQNSLVTRMSGAVVRTTHLTGVITDIGIEAARWFRWWRGTLSERLRLKLAFGRNPPEHPQPVKIELLLTIAGSFALGAIFGAFTGVKLRAFAMLVPSVGLLGGAAYAFVTARQPGESIPPGPSSRG
jgi:uncharacterized membrane protein YoaK (UPF0700 family)